MSSLLLSSTNALRLVARRQATLSSSLASSQQLLQLGVGGGGPTPSATNASSSQRWMSAGGKNRSKKRAINGSRGSRGHGWFLKYREGRGGRHLQGEYWDRRNQHWDMDQWNNAVLELGIQYVYLDVAVEAPVTAAAATASSNSNSVAATADDDDSHEEIDIDVSVTEVEDDEETDEKSTDKQESAEKDAATTTPTTATTTSDPTAPLAVERLVMRVASTVMPETCINFIGLCQEAAYQGTILYRIEKEVGICGGDVLTNTGKTGQCWQDWPYETETAKFVLKPNPLRRDLPPPKEEPMAMWHTAGTVAMLCPKVNEIDSRFLLCGKDAPHLDGIHRAFGTMEASSLAKVQDWQANVLTSYGQPKSVTLRIVGCGVLENYEGETTVGSEVADEAA